MILLKENHINSELLDYINNKDLVLEDLEKLNLKYDCEITYSISNKKISSFKTYGKTMCLYNFKNAEFQSFEILYNNILEEFTKQVNKLYLYYLNDNKIDDVFDMFESGAFLFKELNLFNINELRCSSNLIHYDWIIINIKKNNEVMNDILIEYMESFHKDNVYNVSNLIFLELLSLVKKSTKTILVFKRFYEKFFNNERSLSHIIINAPKIDPDYKRYIDYFVSLYKEVNVDDGRLWVYISTLMDFDVEIDYVFVKSEHLLKRLLGMNKNFIGDIYATDNAVKMFTKQTFTANNIFDALKSSENLIIEEKTKIETVEMIEHMSKFFDQYSEEKILYYKQLRTFDVNNESLVTIKLKKD